jgi:hypothetical protein
MGAGAAAPAVQPAPTRPIRGRRWTWWVAGLLGLCVVWVLVASVTLVLAYLDLREGYAAYGDAARHVSAGELVAARSRLQEGADRSSAASSRLHQPAVAVIAALPVVGPNLEAVTAIADGAATVGGPALGLVDALDRLELGGEPATAQQPSLASLGELIAPLQEVAAALDDTTAAVTAIDPAQLHGPVARAHARFVDMAVPAAEQAALAAASAEVMPALLGHDGPRAYLVLAASLSELRSSGGLPGSWSILRAEDGRLHVEEFRDVDALEALETAVAPPSRELAEAHAARGGLQEWRNVGLAAHFPDAAEVALRMWDATGGEDLDGVLMVDTVAFERLARRAGGLDVPGVGRLDAGEVLPFVALGAYAAFDDHHERKRVLGDHAVAALGATLETLEDDPVGTVRTFHDLAAGGHLRLYTRDQEVQPTLERLGVAGALPAATGEFAGVLLDNLAANKVDAFTSRRLEHRVELLPDGETRATIELELRNAAPQEGYPHYVLGPSVPGLQAGDGLSLVRFVCASGCEHRPVSEAVTATQAEQGLPMADVTLRIPAGQERRVQHRTRSSDAWRLDGDELVVEVAHLIQPTLEPSPLRVSLTVPAGWSPARLPDGARVDGDEIVWEERASGLVDLTFRMRPTNEE